MKKRLMLSLCLALFTSTMAVAVEPIGSLGEGVLQQAHFLPDGTILRVMRDRSGMYFYTLEAGNYRTTSRMTVVR